MWFGDDGARDVVDIIEKKTRDPSTFIFSFSFFNFNNGNGLVIVCDAPYGEKMENNNKFQTISSVSTI